MFVDAYVYRKYHNSFFNIQYLYRGKKYRNVPVHRCIIAGLARITFTCKNFIHNNNNNNNI